MMTPRGEAKVLEYNVRFGDPETQSVLPLLETDLAELVYACTNSTLSSLPIRISTKSAATVVLAAGGYPGSYAKGTPIELAPEKAGQEVQEHVVVFHAGTVVKDGKLVTSGGRVIAATATGKDLREAVDKAYAGVKGIKFDGMQFRKDIAAKGLQ